MSVNPPAPNFPPSLKDQVLIFWYGLLQLLRSASGTQQKVLSRPETFRCWGFFCRDGAAAGTGKDDPFETLHATGREPAQRFCSDG